MEPHERLDRAMNARRIKLGLTWRAVSDAAKITDEALRSFRNGKYRPSELVAARLDAALRWCEGSVNRTLRNGEPIPLEAGLAPKAPTVRSETPDPDREWKDRIIAEGVAEAEKVLGSLPPEEAAQLLDQMRTLVAGFRARRGERREPRRDVG